MRNTDLFVIVGPNDPTNKGQVRVVLPGAPEIRRAGVDDVPDWPDRDDESEV